MKKQYEDAVMDLGGLLVAQVAGVRGKFCPTIKKPPE
jgi:hypothetical protein